MRESKLLQLRNRSVFAPYFMDFVVRWETNTMSA